MRNYYCVNFGKLCEKWDISKALLNYFLIMMQGISHFIDTGTGYASIP